MPQADALPTHLPEEKTGFLDLVRLPNRPCGARCELSASRVRLDSHRCVLVTLRDHCIA